MTVEAQRAAPPTDGIEIPYGNGENSSLYLNRRIRNTACRRRSTLRLYTHVD